MMVGLPAIPFLLLVPAKGRRPAAIALAVTLAFMLGLAVPTLTTTNWNSGANGMMRYALWGSMPLFYLVFARLRNVERWPVKSLAVVLVLQVLVMAHARSYSPKQFSPLGRMVLRYAHAAYNPDPDIFFNRANHTDLGPDPKQIARWPAHGPITKAMVHVRNAGAGEALCGQGLTLVSPWTGRAAIRGWRYVDGPVQCVAPVDAIGHGAHR
jgi:hypothetical protein